MQNYKEFRYFFPKEIICLKIQNINPEFYILKQKITSEILWSQSNKYVGNNLNQDIRVIVFNQNYVTYLILSLIY